jgi:hypothetical protein
MAQSIQNGLQTAKRDRSLQGDLAEEPQHPAARHALANRNLAPRINAVNLEDRLRDI